MYPFGFGTFPDSSSILNFVFPGRFLAFLAPLALASSIMAKYCVHPSSPTPSFSSLAFYSIGAILVPTGIGEIWQLYFFFHNGPLRLAFFFFVSFFPSLFSFFPSLSFSFPFIFPSLFLSVILTFNWFSFPLPHISTFFQYVLLNDPHKKFSLLVSFLSLIFLFYLKKNSSLMVLQSPFGCFNCFPPDNTVPIKISQLNIYLFFFLSIFFFKFIQEITCFTCLQK